MTVTRQVPSKKIPNLFFRNITSNHLIRAFEAAYSKFPSLHDSEVLLEQLPLSGYTMRAQPVIDYRIVSTQRRRYRIQISNHLEIAQYIQLKELPQDVLVGWFAHELGHIVDYHQRSVFSLLKFIIGYAFFPTYRAGTERRADLFAIERGFGNELMATKVYILDQSTLPSTYKDRIRKYYMSPDELEMLLLEKETERVHSKAP